MNEALQQMLKEVGIEVTFEVFDWNSLLGTWREGAGAPSSRAAAMRSTCPIPRSIPSRRWCGC